MEVDMLEIIRNFTTKMANHNYRVLWVEAVVLAVIIGAGLASWPGVIILLAVLTWVLNRHWGTVYLIGIFSCSWAFLAGMIGYGLGGWAWALLLGVLALISGVKIHLRDLKRSQEYENIETYVSAEKWRQNWHLGPQNLN
jgi:hypothetical protein